MSTWRTEAAVDGFDKTYASYIDLRNAILADNDAYENQINIYTAIQNPTDEQSYELFNLVQRYDENLIYIQNLNDDIREMNQYLIQHE